MKKTRQEKGNSESRCLWGNMLKDWDLRFESKRNISAIWHSSTLRVAGKDRDKVRFGDHMAALTRLQTCSGVPITPQRHPSYCWL